MLCRDFRIGDAVRWKEPRVKDAFILQRERDLIALHERCVLKPYDDADGGHVGSGKIVKGKVTIGWGWNLTDNGIPQDIADMLRERALADALREVRGALPWFDGIDPVRKVAMLDMAYNMGTPKLLTFKHMLGSAEKKKWTMAATHAMASKWYLQTGTRARRIVRMLRTGQWPEDVTFQNFE